MVHIVVEDVWKSFRIYEERAHSLKEVLLVRRSSYESFWALQDVSIDAYDGEMVGLIGPNGSGKSTLLKIIARIYTANRGNISIQGKLSAMLELGVGFHPELSGHDNVYLAGSLAGLSTADIDSRYADIVEFAGIPDFMDSAVKNFSSGMFARLAFALAINVDAEILLIDEVLAVGDVSFQRKCHKKINEIRKSGATVVFVTHSLDVVRTMCTRAVWLQSGRVIKTGDASDVVSDYFEAVSGAEAQRGVWVSPPAGDRIGTGEVSVTNITLRDKAGIELDSFIVGQECNINLEYQARQDVNDVMCVLELRRSDGTLVGRGVPMSSNQTLNFAKGGGNLVYAIGALPMIPANYKITVGLHDVDKKKIYDWLEQTVTLTVNGPQADENVLFIPGKWKNQPGA